MTVKISNLPAATSVGSGDVIPVVQSGTTKKIDLNSPWNINIDGGNIDGTPIGVSSASSGAFTTLTASGDVNFDSGTLFVDASANKVGIGNTTPATLLDLLSGTAAEMRAIRASGRSVHLYADSTNAIYAYNTGALRIGETTSTVASNFTERMRIDSSGNVGIGVTPSDWSGGFSALQIGNGSSLYNTPNNNGTFVGSNFYWNGSNNIYINTSTATAYGQNSGTHQWFTAPSGTAGDPVAFQERMRIDSSGDVLVGNTVIPNPGSSTDTGFGTQQIGYTSIARSGGNVLNLARQTNDGEVVGIYQGGSKEGSISVSGSTVSYNGGHLSRWSRLPSGEQDASILKGTVMTNLDAMVEWEGEDNEQLNQMAVSSVEGDPNVSGVFVNWDIEDDWNDMNIAMTGDMIIRIGAGVTVQRGDLLMSAGDGTAKPQGDDVVKSKTIAKVTSTHVTCTYDDGSYCVPCVLMAC